MEKLQLFGMLDYKTKKIAAAVAFGLLIVCIALRFTSFDDGLLVRFIDYTFLTTLLLVAASKEKVDDERTGLIRNFSSRLSYGILLIALMVTYLYKLTFNPFYLSLGSLVLYFTIFYSLEYKNPDVLFINEGTEINKKRYFKLILYITISSAIIGFIIGLLLFHFKIGKEFISRFALKSKIEKYNENSMHYNKTTWCTEVQTKLHLAKEIERSGIEYLSNLFTRIVSDEIELELDLQRKIDTMMKEFPKKVAKRFLITSSYINQLSNIKKIIMKRYNLTYKGYNRTKYFSWGIGFGLG